MPMSDNRWTTVSPSEFAHEQAALDYIRKILPDHSPYRAWSNFEFTTHDGRIYEVDLLVFSKAGVFLIEIKSYKGVLMADGPHWRYTSPGGRARTEDNPRSLANKKAKVLSGLVKQYGKWSGSRSPFVQAIVYLSELQLDARLRGHAADHGLFFHDAKSDLPGIKQALIDGEGPGLRRPDLLDRPTMKRFASAIDAIGIRPSSKAKRVAGLELGDLIEDTPRYQDYLATNSAAGTTRRVRIFRNAKDASVEARQQLAAAARREFRLLEELRHPAILDVKDFVEHDRGPSLVFERPDHLVRLDHYLADHDDLSALDRLTILRAVTEAVRYAHERRVVHRSLCPQNVLIDERFPKGRLEIRLLNWHTGLASEGTTQGTLHVLDFTDAERQTYLAPEVVLDPANATEAADVYALGALAYTLFSGAPPATDLAHLNQVLQAHGGLRLSAKLDAVRPELDGLVYRATRTDTSQRIASAKAFAAELEGAESAFTAPDDEVALDPLSAKPEDVLGDQFIVKRRLGKGSTALALLAHDADSDRDVVLKVALSEGHAQRLSAEAKALGRFDHKLIVELYDQLTIEGRTTLVLEQAGSESLRDTLRKDGRLSLDNLHRFGDDLLEIVETLEQVGVSHRDIKPANLGIGEPVGGREKRLMLFDFSLAGVPIDQIRVGTAAYRDPFLGDPSRMRWDDSAERYAAGVTLHEMASGRLPDWGDGQSAPALVPEAALLLDDKSFPAPVRDGLRGFFQRALARERRDRFHNAEEMRAAWVAVFETTRHTQHEVSGDLAELLRQVVPSNSVRSLGMSETAADALDRLNVVSIEDFQEVERRRLQFLKGASADTRRELLRLHRLVNEHFPTLEPETDGDGPTDFARLSIEDLVDYVCEQKKRAKLGDAQREWARALLGLGDDAPAWPWPTRAELAKAQGIAVGELNRRIEELVAHWGAKKFAAPLIDDLRRLLARHGEVMTSRELAQALLAVRGSLEDDPTQRLAKASAVARVAVELALADVDSDIDLTRASHAVFVGRAGGLLSHTKALGAQADELATEFPPPSASRAYGTLLDRVPTEVGASVSQHRLLAIAAAASKTAALSSREEIYPRGMAPERTLRLVRGVLTVSGRLTLEALQARTHERYPEAEALPGPPALDRLLVQADVPLRFDPTVEPDGAYVVKGGYGPHLTNFASTSAAATSIASLTETERQRDAFAERLGNAAKRGGLLAVMAEPKAVEPITCRLADEFELPRLSAEALWLDAATAFAQRHEFDPDVLFDADRPDAPADDKRQLGFAMAEVAGEVTRRLLDEDGPYLLERVGLFGRFDQLVCLERLRDEVGRPGRPHHVWLVLPVDWQHTVPVIDSAVLPTIDPSERVRVPRHWTE